jgi:hypothetical protein
MKLQGSRRITRKALMWIMGLVFAVGNTAAQDRPQAAPVRCVGPTANVIVMALQDPDNGDAHMIIVKNDTRYSVYVLIVGLGQESELHSSSFAVPRQIVGPPGWEARSLFEEESLFMRWMWNANSTKAAIAPGELVSGFKVVLPPFPAVRPGDDFPDHAPVIPIKFSDLPFRVLFENGECAWGRVRPLVLGSPTK